jgi:formamidopyrimidine-DNA glycosylase
MPELPEVETARRLIENNCVGKLITEAVVADDESEWSIFLMGFTAPRGYLPTKTDMFFWCCRQIQCLYFNACTEVFQCDPKKLEKSLVGLIVQRACRKGKLLWLDFGAATPALVLHFGMTGTVPLSKGIALSWSEINEGDAF